MAMAFAAVAACGLRGWKEQQPLQRLHVQSVAESGGSETQHLRLGMHVPGMQLCTAAGPIRHRHRHLSLTSLDLELWAKAPVVWQAQSNSGTVKTPLSLVPLPAVPASPGPARCKLRYVPLLIHNHYSSLRLSWLPAPCFGFECLLSCKQQLQRKLRPIEPPPPASLVFAFPALGLPPFFLFGFSSFLFYSLPSPACPSALLLPLFLLPPCPSGLRPGSPLARSRMATPCASVPLVVGLLFLLLLQASGTAEASVLEFSHRSAREKVSTPEEVVRLLKDHAITVFWLSDANHVILRALGNSSINVIVGVRNAELEDLAGDSDNARVWVERNILPFVGGTNVTAIAVGDESPIRTLPLTVKQVQAMRNLHQSLSKAELDLRIEVSSPRSLSFHTSKLSFASLKSTRTPDQEFVLSFNENPAKHRRLADDRGFVWCVVRDGANVYDVQAALNWTCARINCKSTEVEGTCFYPNTIWAHASWAFNAYFNSMNGAQDSCNFSGTAYVSSNDPSSETCFYQGTNSALAVVSNACMHGRTVALSIATSIFAYLLVLVIL